MVSPIANIPSAKVLRRKRGWALVVSVGMGDFLHGYRIGRIGIASE